MYEFNSHSWQFLVYNMDEASIPDLPIFFHLPVFLNMFHVGNHVFMKVGNIKTASRPDNSPND